MSHDSVGNGFGGKMLWLVFLLSGSLFVAINGAQTSKLAFDLIRTVPKFSEDSIDRTKLVVLNENTTLDSEILSVKAYTYDAGSPIFYDLIDDQQYFKINSTSGVIKLQNTLKHLKEYKFTIIAKDSAPFADQQFSYLIANVQIISSTISDPTFNDDTPYYVSIPEVTTPYSLIYDKIIVSDGNLGQHGQMDIYCDDYELNYGSSQSCEYFSVEKKPLENSQYQVFVRLIKNLDKSQFLVTITARVGFSKASSNLLVDVEKTRAPKFDREKYFLSVEIYSTRSNVLQVSVNNLDSNDFAFLSFRLSDPYNNFKMSNERPICEITTCRQTIELISAPQKLIQYQMLLYLVNEKADGHFRSIKAPIYVIVEPSTRIAKQAPEFLNTPSEFFISKGLKANQLITNVSIFVNQDENLSVSNSGFYLELLRKDLFTKADELFELVPYYGTGSLITTLRLKQNLAQVFANSKFDFVLKATSTTNRDLFSLKNITIHVLADNQHSPYFPLAIYSAVINLDEHYKTNNYIFQLEAVDLDQDEQLEYKILGKYAQMFSIDQMGKVFLAKNFDFNTDESTSFTYNLTVMVSDQAGRTNFTSLILNLNSTLPIYFRNSGTFECTLNYPRSELSPVDRKTLQPPLFITANSKFPVQYKLLDSLPYLDQLEVDQYSGQVSFRSPLNSSMLENLLRIEISVKAYQYRYFNSILLYSSSIKCTATVYLKTFSLTDKGRKEPAFLREYSVKIFDELILKTIPILRVEAVSKNSLIHSPLIYTLSDGQDNFIIDSAQGFIYPRRDLILEPGISQIKVKVTEQISGYSSHTAVVMFVQQRLKLNSIRCSQDYLIMKLKSENSFSDETGDLNQLGCLAMSYFKSAPINFDIFSSPSTYDCSGNKIDYTPNVGIDLLSGRIIAFEKLSRKNFCDSLFLIMIHKDEISTLVPLKIVLIDETQSKYPVFDNSSQMNFLKSNFINIGFHVMSAIAYDPATRSLVDDYELASQVTSPFTNKDYFKVDKKTGFVTLNEFPSVNTAQLTISAKSASGFVAKSTFSIDLSSISSIYGTNLALNTNSSSNVYLATDKIYSKAIYKTDIDCVSSNQALTSSKALNCDFVLYSMDYIQNDQNGTDFQIDSSTGNVYSRRFDLVSNKVPGRSYLTVINAKREANYTNRFVNSVQKTLQIVMDNNRPTDASISIFECDEYSVQIENTMSINSAVLAIKYKPLAGVGVYAQHMEFTFDHKSNNEIENYFFLEHDAHLRTVYVKIRQSPLKIDKPEINFIVRLKNTYSLRENAFVRVSIRLLDATGHLLPKYPIFVAPESANSVLNVNLTERMVDEGEPLFKLQAVSPIGSLIGFRLLNDKSPFYISNNFIKISKDFMHANLMRHKYLLFIEAYDMFNPNQCKSSTTLEIHLYTFIRKLPYFKRDLFGGPLNVQINGNYSINAPILDLKPFVFIPEGSLVYFYVFNLNDLTQSDTFYVDSQTLTVKPKKYLQFCGQNFVFNLFVYVTNCVLSSNVYFYRPTLNNTQLLFVNFIINDYVDIHNFFFVDYTSHIVIEDTVSIDYTMGHVQVNRNDSVLYRLEECNMVFKSLVYKDSTFCELFKIDSQYGIISTNNSNFAPFKSNFFILKISAMSLTNTWVKIYIEIRVFILNRYENGRIIFKSFPIQNRVGVLKDLKIAVNEALNRQYPNVYYFNFNNLIMPQLHMNSSQLDVCYFVLNRYENTILNYRQSKELLLYSNDVRAILELFSIKDIERCSNLEDNNLNGFRFYINGLWMLVSPAIGLIVLVCLLILFVLFCIMMICCCWVSHFRQALITPVFECDNNVDTCSNNFLIENQCH